MFVTFILWEKNENVSKSHLFFAEIYILYIHCICRIYKKRVFRIEKLFSHVLRSNIIERCQKQHEYFSFLRDLLCFEWHVAVHF